VFSPLSDPLRPTRADRREAPLTRRPAPTYAARASRSCWACSVFRSILSSVIRSGSGAVLASVPCDRGSGRWRQWRKLGHGRCSCQPAYRAPFQCRGVGYGDVGDIGPGVAAAGVRAGDEGSCLVIAAYRVVWRSTGKSASADGNGSQKHSAR
jgi:hypothetical protein